MRLLTIEPDKLWRPSEDPKEISFIPPISGPAYLVYPMHWVAGTGIPEPFICLEFLGYRCPLCSSERRKQRVIMNVWIEGDKKPLIWDINLFLLTKAWSDNKKTNYSEDTLLKYPGIWDPSKYGESLIVRKKPSDKWPEYSITKRVRRFAIPGQVLNEPYNLSEIIYQPTPTEWNNRYNQFRERLNNIVGLGKETIEGSSPQIKFERITTNIGLTKGEKKSQQKIKPEKPNPYEKRVRRKVIIDD